jgi:hypothetical protein
MLRAVKPPTELSIKLTSEVINGLPQNHVVFLHGLFG